MERWLTQWGPREQNRKVLQGEDFDAAAEMIARTWEGSRFSTSIARSMDVIVSLETAGFVMDRRDPGPQELDAALEASLKQVEYHGRVLRLLEDACHRDAEIVEFPK